MGKDGGRGEGDSELVWKVELVREIHKKGSDEGVGCRKEVGCG